MVMRMEDLLAEDEGYGDITSDLLIGNEGGAAEIVAGEDCVVAGLAEAVEVFRLLTLDARPQVEEGCEVKKGAVVMTVKGPLKAILLGERLSLNFIMRMSGIATVTANILWECRRMNKNVRIAATRKTTPGFRFYEKRAVALGGGDPHRNRLDDMVLIKDNHIVAAGGIGSAVAAVRKYAPHTLRVEVEVENLAQVDEALAAGAEILLLDNMTAEMMRAAVERVAGRALTEASGNMGDRDLREVAATGVDYISIGALTHSVRAMDISLRFE